MEDTFAEQLAGFFSLKKAFQRSLLELCKYVDLGRKPTKVLTDELKVLRGVLWQSLNAKLESSRRFVTPCIIASASMLIRSISEQIHITRSKCSVLTSCEIQSPP
jgi:hypothetical protein